MVNMYSVKSFFFSLKLHQEKRNGFGFCSKSYHSNKVCEDFERKQSGALGCAKIKT